jgi:hypothetical protein
VVVNYSRSADATEDTVTQIENGGAGRLQSEQMSRMRAK